MWPFQFVALSVCRPFGLWPFWFVAVMVRGCFGVWLPWSVVVSVCGGSSLWPFSVCGCLGYVNFRVWPLRIVTTMIHVSIYTFHEARGQISVRDIQKNNKCALCIMVDAKHPKYTWYWNCLVSFPRDIFLCLVNLNIMIFASWQVTWSAVERYFANIIPNPNNILCIIYSRD